MPPDRRRVLPAAALCLYCLASGTVGTLAATYAALLFAGSARVAVWLGIFLPFSVLAGFAGVAYDSPPARILTAAARRAAPRRHH